MTEANAVAVEDLTRRFGALTAVDRLSFSVRRGELFGLLGPDGAGKTTTLRMLSGVLRPSAGDAFLDGVSVVREPERVKHGLAYMSQRFGLYADLTVLENIEFYADLYRVPRAARAARFERLFRFSNLGPFKDRLAGKLSGGMKQKLALACTLIHSPEVLLLDEPTSALDPRAAEQVDAVVGGLVGAGLSVVLVSHDLQRAAALTHDALVLDEGRLVDRGDPADVTYLGGG